MKKLIVLLSVTTLLITGCTITRLDNKSLDSIIEIILKENVNYKNTVFDGYSYYVPRGLKFINKDDYNALLSDQYDNHYYLYVDVVSYYNGVEEEYKVDKDSYFSKRLNYKKKDGYLEINKVGNKYFIEFMYNYAKVEAYVEKKDIEDAIINISYMLSSIKYNNKVLATTVGENTLNYKEENFTIFKTKKKTTNFLDYVKEYDNADKKKTQDEDTLDIDESE